MLKNTDNKPQKLLILDLDGTLYRYNKGSFDKSDLKKEVLLRAGVFIKDKLGTTQGKAKKILDKIVSDYGEHVSVGLEKQFGIDRLEYFDTVWDINPGRLLMPNLTLHKMLRNLQVNGYKIVIVSDAPKVWINNVLAYFDISDIFDGKVFSGESDRRKSYGNTFNYVLQTLNCNPKDCIIVGDQEQTDIIPAKKIGARAVFVNRQTQSKFADYNIKSILDLKKVLNFL